MLQFVFTSHLLFQTRRLTLIVGWWGEKHVKHVRTAEGTPRGLRQRDELLWSRVGAVLCCGDAMRAAALRRWPLPVSSGVLWRRMR